MLLSGWTQVHKSPSFLLLPIRKLDFFLLRCNQILQLSFNPISCITDDWELECGNLVYDIIHDCRIRWHLYIKKWHVSDNL